MAILPNMQIEQPVKIEERPCAVGSPASIMLNDEQLGQCSDVFKALGHPARLRMVAELFGGEQCVCTLRDAVGLDMSTVSRHLSVLRQAGVVHSRKEGNWAYYSLKLQCVEQFLGCLGHKLIKKDL